MSALITEHLPVWTSAPNGIAKLRQLILDLAVRGRLVPQEAGDEPAGELVKQARSYSEKNMPQKALKVATGKWETPDIDLPTGWAWACNALLGDTSPRNESSDDAVVAFAPMHVVPTDFRQKIVPQTRAWGEIKKGYTHFADGDIVVAKITPCFENGKACVMSNLPGGIGAGTTEFHVLRPYPKTVVPQYMLLFYQTHGFIQGGVDTFSGTAGHQRVSNDYFRFRPIPLPPLPEQHRIVAKVDELMAFCDRLEATQGASEKAHLALVEVMLGALASAKDAAEVEACWGRIAGCFDVLFTTVESVEALKKVVLELGVRGRLVRQEVGDEPAGELVKRIRAEKLRLGKKEKVMESIGEVPFELPKGWTWARFPELGTFGRGKSKHRPRNDHSLFADGIYPLVQTGDVARSKGTIRTYTSKYNEKGLAQSAMWPKGTLCITIAANIADSGLLTFDACFPDSVVGFIPATLFSSAQYFEYFLRTAKADITAFAPATAQKNINLEILNSVLIPLPPLPEQHRIVAKVTELLSLCDALKAQVSAAKKLQGHLADAIVQ